MKKLLFTLLVGLLGVAGADAAIKVSALPTTNVLVAADLLLTTVDTGGTPKTFAVTAGNLFGSGINPMLPVGINVTSPSAGLDVAHATFDLLVGSDDGATTRTDEVNKLSRVGAAHYTNAEQAMAVFVTTSSSVANTLNFGGGSGDFNAATVHKFYTTSNTVQTTGSERMRIYESGGAVRVGIGTTTADGELHVMSGAGAGSVTAQTSADTLIVEDESHAGISIITKDNLNSSLYFASPTDNIGALVDWNYDSGLARFSTSKAGGEISFNTASIVEAVRIDATGQVGIGTNAPGGKLHVVGAGIAGVAANASADDLIIEGNGAAGASLITVDASSANLYFGSTSDNIGAQINWNHDADLMVIGTANADDEISLRTADNVEAVRIDATGQVGIGTNAPGTTVHINGSFATESIIELLEADNQGVTNITSYISLSSDDGTASSRTFVLTSGLANGQLLSIEWTGTNQGELVDDSGVTGGGNARLSATWTPTQYDVLSLRWNGTDWIETGRIAN